jgi:hypothetical protein
MAHKAGGDTTMKIMPDLRPRPSVPTEAEIAERCARSLKIRQQMVTDKEIKRLEWENEKLRKQADKA